MRSGLKPYARTVGAASIVLIVPLIVIAVVGAAVAGPATFLVLVNFFITVVLVVGLQVFVGNSGVVSWSGVVFVGVGAYTAAWLTIPNEIKTSLFPALPHFLLTAHMSLVPATLIAGCVSALIALVVGIPISRMRETAMAMSTLALLVIGYGLFVNWIGVTHGVEGVYGLPTNTTLFIATVAACLAVTVGLAYRYSRRGLQLQASREDPLAAGASGISVRRVRLIAWVLSGVIGGIGGALWAQYNLAFGPDQFYFAQVFSILSMLVIGGMASVSGSVLGAGIVTVAFELLRRVEEDGRLFGLTLPKINGIAQMGLAVITLIILIYRHDGLLGRKELIDWLRDLKSWLTRRRSPQRGSAPENAAGVSK